MARENESTYFGATFKQIAKECDFKTPALARKFVDRALGKMMREMTRRGINDSQMPRTENPWDKLDNI